MPSSIDPRRAWERYVPDASNPWDLKKVGHLYRRAAFGANWSELQAGLKADPQELITGLLRGGSPAAHFDAATDDFLAKAARKFNDGNQASAWWLYRIMYGGHPLREKLSLFWHNHFATSNAKVQNVGYMVGQYDLIQRHALGSFAELLQGMSKDPAMMVWLDTIQSKKGTPNENYARELMELFSLGIGHYSEKDIREAARAFTGWEIKDGKFHENKSEFDASTKAVLGRTGEWRGQDIVRICLEQKACARFIVNKLYRFLISESEVPAAALIDPLAEKYAVDYDTGKLVETMLRSNLFFSEHAYRARIKSPVDFVAGMARSLEAQMGTNGSGVNLTVALQTLGQQLFHPPSVKGWDGGTAWLNGQTLLFRQNLALDMARRPAAHRQPASAAVIASKLASPQSMGDLFLNLLLQGDVAEDVRQRVRDYSSAPQKVPSYWTKADAAEHRAVSVCHLVMTLPEYQLD